MESFEACSTAKAALFSCSPRPGGNSDQAALLFAQGLHEVGGSGQTVVLRRHTVHPCVGCHRCEHDPDRACFLASMDQSGRLFQLLQSAPLVFFASPIYFYHLPAIFKMFIDRGQSYFLRYQDKDKRLLALPRRKAHVCLVAGRKRGEHLFEGSLLTLRYFLAPFNLELAEPLLLRGLDLPNDLANDPAAGAAVLEYGRAAWRELAQSPAC